MTPKSFENKARNLNDIKIDLLAEYQLDKYSCIIGIAPTAQLSYLILKRVYHRRKSSAGKVQGLSGDFFWLEPTAG